MTHDPHIGTLNEGGLHAALKRIYAEPGDDLEVPLEGFVVDIRRADCLIEIQTGSFASMGSKLDRLLEAHRILIVHPIATRVQLRRPDGSGRRSPRRGVIHDLFDELVSWPTLLDHPNLELEIALVEVIRHQRFDPKARRGRGGYRTVDHELLDMVGRHRFVHRRDLLDLLPGDLPDVFTTADVAERGLRRDTAQKMLYCLRALDLVAVEGRNRSGICYTLAD